MTQAPPCRLDIFFAADVPRAVILRRGPTQHVRMVEWDTKTDRFTDGQWVKHRVYSEKCSLSPDGRHFAYFGYGNRSGQGDMLGGFLAISEVPYFTALGGIAEGSTWGHGGRFIDTRHVLCPYLHQAGIAPLPAPLRWVWHPNAYGVARDQVPSSQQNASDHFVLADGQRADIKREAIARVLAAWPLVPTVPDLPKWCAVEDGCLYRIGRKGARVLLRDFNADVFEAVQAPYMGVSL